MAHAAKEIQWQKFNSWKLQSPLIAKILNGEVLSNWNLSDSPDY